MDSFLPAGFLSPLTDETGGSSQGAVDCPGRKPSPPGRIADGPRSFRDELHLLEAQLKKKNLDLVVCAGFRGVLQDPLV